MRPRLNSHLVSLRRTAEHVRVLLRGLHDGVGEHNNYISALRDAIDQIVAGLSPPVLRRADAKISYKKRRKSTSQVPPQRAPPSTDSDG